MKYYILLIALLVLSCKNEVKKRSESPIVEAPIPEFQLIKAPDELLGDLFVKVQLSQVFEDGKTFVDCTAKYPYEEIKSNYDKQKNKPNFDLKSFVLDHFEVPPSISSDFKADSTKTAVEHVTSLWPILKRASDKKNDLSTLIPLPKPYIVPGGRFREVYYWDSYFTMLGLVESGEFELIENMLDNFAHLINTVGHIPNGNRTYYITRSQPPFFSQMVKLLADHNGDTVYQKYKEALKKEYEFWMDGAATTSYAVNHAVLTPVGILNRYYDKGDTPRQESYREDYTQVEKTNGGTKMYRDLRSGAESGWDYSSRWFADGKTIETIETTDILPVDLNALMYGLEEVLLNAYEGDSIFTTHVKKSMETRKEFLNRYSYNEAAGVFEDYNWVKSEQTGVISLATTYPLFFKMVSQEQADKVAKYIAEYLLKPGGVVTSSNNTGQQWDAPNGWAPLQWMTIVGLENYGHHELAKIIATRWITLNEKVYENTGKFVEKYNVEDMTLDAGGGEYPVQDGFGWSNGVYLALKNHYKKD
ncbi:alpha,alpha-trehalase TreF [Cellulophaga sp. L1A9]|uniref:alpha,alpha-trehalase TreF n=1 Tax=Cellulophaga sp. L1A9 TaxID=2686362 RepID=UPI00131E0F81|nr:alpha,alpha-trehalase TreF [Cellulophaga sp. L1A9]